MSKNKPEIGSITWVDLTIPEAKKVRDFYTKIIGCKYDSFSMGEYDDFVMLTPESGNGAAGVCHARGGNANLPPQWLIYITVENVDEGALKCKELGGKILAEPKEMRNYGKYCVIQDPAGAVCALFESK